MSSSYTYHSLTEHRHTNVIQRYKMRTLLCLVSVTTCILVILCLTHAHPLEDDSSDSVGSSSAQPFTLAVSSAELNSSTTAPSTSTDISQSSSSSSSSTSESAVSTIAPKPVAGHLNNGSKLVITNVVKTVEFEVALEEDDNSTESSSGESTTKFLETDIKVLNPSLLEEIVLELSSTHENLEKSIDGTKSQSSELDDDDDYNSNYGLI